MVMVFTTADTEVIPTVDMENPIMEEAMEAENTTEEVMVDTEVATDTEVNPNTEELQDMAEAIRTEELRDTEVTKLLSLTGRKTTSSTKMDTSLQMKIKNEIKPWIYFTIYT